MPTCPACSGEAPAGAGECPTCHLSVDLFEAVREAAGPAGRQDPVFLQTVGELLRSVDLTAPVAPAEGDPSSDPAGSRPAPPTLHDRPARAPEAMAPLDELPALPPRAHGDELRRRFEEYRQLGRRLGIDLGDPVARAGPAALVSDDSGLEGILREMFVRLADRLAEEFERALARRNELAQLVPTPGADVELASVRRAISVGDLAGASRRLDHVRDELAHVEEEWATGRILATECDLLAETLRELGGDPEPALGPLEEGRKFLGSGRREAAEQMLARAAIALWSLLKPRFTEELKRLRDRLVEVRAAGGDIGPAVAELRTITLELRVRNFVGTIGAYRALRTLVGGGASPGPAPDAPPGPPGSPPSG